MWKSILASGALALGACASTGSDQGMGGTTTNSGQKSVQVYFTERCPIYEGAEPGASAQLSFLATIGSALLAGAIDQGLSAFSSALSKAGDKKVTKRPGSRIATLMERDVPNFGIAIPAEGVLVSEADAKDLAEKIDPTALKLASNMGCVLIVAGEFDSTLVNPAIGHQQFTYGQTGTIPRASLKNASGAELKTHLNAAGVPLAKAPEFIYEARVDYSAHNKAFWLTSTFLHVGRFKSTSSQSAKRAVAVALAIDSPRTAAEAATLRAISLEFGDLTAGTTLVAGGFKKGARSALIQSFAPDENAKSAFAKISDLEKKIVLTKAAITANELLLERAKEDLQKKPDDVGLKRIVEDHEKTLQSSLDTLIKDATLYLQINETNKIYMPVEFNATVLETRKENAMLKFLAGVFEKASSDLGTAFKDEIVPANLEKAKESEKAEREAVEDALSTARLGYLNAKKVVAALTDQSDAYDRQIAEEGLLAAITKYNRARLNAGLSAIVK